MHNEPFACGTTPPQQFITNTQGRDLFRANCASCHAIYKQLIGPALAGWQNRFPAGLLYLFIQQPLKACKKSRYMAQLKKQYNGMQHYAFPNLAKKDIDNIMQYISQAGKSYGY